MQVRDSNLRPSGYEPDELPDCSTLLYTDAVFRGICICLCNEEFTTPVSAIRLAYPLHLILHDTIIKHSKGHCKDTILTSFCLLQNQCIYSK